MEVFLKPWIACGLTLNQLGSQRFIGIPAKLWTAPVRLHQALTQESMTRVCCALPGPLCKVNPLRRSATKLSMNVSASYASRMGKSSADQSEEERTGSLHDSVSSFEDLSTRERRLVDWR